MSNTSLRENIRAFLERYGEKALMVLKTAYDISRDPSVDHRIGDFSFKHLVSRLYNMGINYNPVNILRIMEKEYNIIEKSYTSSNQTWWRFRDIELVREILGEMLSGVDKGDPRTKALLVKYRSLEPLRTRDLLRRLAFKTELSNADKNVFKEFVFKELDKIISVLSEMEYYEDYFAPEIAMLREILNLAEMVSAKLEKPKTNSTIVRRDEVLTRNVDTRIDLHEDITSY
ncbi:MAG: hypothetical protein QXP02_03155 [Desulfurococcaceae archaeon]